MAHVELSYAGWTNVVWVKLLGVCVLFSLFDLVLMFNTTQCRHVVTRYCEILEPLLKKSYLFLAIICMYVSEDG